MKKSVILSSLVSCFMLLSLAAHATVPVITTDPTSDTVCSGSIAKFFVVANDTPGATPIGYKWQVSTDGGGTWSFITDTPPYSHSGTDTLFVTASNILNGYQYRSIDSNTDGADTSLAAMLTVDTLNAGIITGPSILCVGSSATFTSTIAGGAWSHVSHLVDTLTPATGFVTGSAAGYDTITYSVTNTCGVTGTAANLRVDTTITAHPISGPTATCVGHTITLTNANTVGTSTWSVSNANASIATTGVLTGLAPGLDTVTYSFTNACSSVSSSLVVAVDVPLSAGAISGDSGVCAGSWIPLTETVGGGVWISSSLVAVVDGSGNVTGVSSGTATISYLLSNACGSSVATHVVTVNAAAGPITGPDSVGVGHTVTLSDGVPGGTWSVDPITVAVHDTASVFSGIAPGTATVTYTVTNLCGTSSSTMTLYVGAAPSAGTITGADSVCIGATTTLSDAVAGGTWRSSADTIAIIDSNTGVVTGLHAGFTTITYTVRNGFGSSSVTHVVWVASRPVIRLFAPAMSLGATGLIYAYPYGGTFLETVTSGGVFVSVSSGFDSSGVYSVGHFIPTRYGSNTIHYVVHTPCGDADSSFTFSIVNAGVKGVNSGSGILNVYPNPNTGEFTVNLASDNNEPAEVVITNIVGEKVKEFTTATNNSTTIKLDQPAGMYFLSVNTASGKYTAKITIAN